jgi:pimeloyl-ACP methyl ester carboxylesterase
MGRKGERRPWAGFSREIDDGVVSDPQTGRKTMTVHETRFFTASGRERQSPGHRLAYHEWGAPENPRVLLCVHGLTRNAMDFSVLAETLREDWRVIAVDMPGRGKSDWLENAADYTYPTYLADIVSLLDHLAIPDVDWLGTSMGGIIGMMMAGFSPDRVRRLVLNDVGAWIPAQGLRRILSYAGKQMHFSSRTEAEGALRANFAPFGIRDEANWHRLFASSLVEDADGSVRLCYDPAIGASLTAQPEVSDIDLGSAWEAVRCPTLILRGADSDILTRETAEAMCRQRPGVTLVEFPGVGHAPSLMEPDQITPVEDWLNSRDH